MVEWKKLPTRANYSVSDQGQVRNDKTGRILKQSPNKHGYARVSLSNGASNNPSILFPHRVVAELFIPNPNNLPVVNHKNTDKMDPRKDNLEWTTYKENTRHAIANKLWDPVKISKKANEASVLVNSKPLKVIGSDGSSKEFPSISSASRELGIPYTTFQRAIKRGTTVKGFNIGSKE